MLLVQCGSGDVGGERVGWRVSRPQAKLVAVVCMRSVQIMKEDGRGVLRVSYNTNIKRVIVEQRNYDCN